jgi:hypothetical protein
LIFDVYADGVTTNFTSFFGNHPTKPFYSSDPLLLLGGENETDLYTAKFAVTNNGRVFIGGGIHDGRWEMSGSRLSCFASKEKNAVYAWEIEGTRETTGHYCNITIR